MPGTCFRSPTSISAGRSRPAMRGKHAWRGAGRECCFVAQAATWPSLPLRSATASEQQSTSAPGRRLTWPPVRKTSSDAVGSSAAGTAQEQQRRRNRWNSIKPAARSCELARRGPSYSRACGSATASFRPARCATENSGGGGNRTRVRDRVQGGIYEHSRRSDLALDSPRQRGRREPASKQSPERLKRTAPSEPAI
jgi:hypothetical protein